MPLFLLIVGLVIIDAGVRGTAGQLALQVKTDAQGFLSFALVIIILGAAGAIDSIRPIAKAMLFLVFTVFILKNGTRILAGLNSAEQPSAPSPAPAPIANPLAAPSFNDLQHQTATQIGNIIPSLPSLLGTTDPSFSDVINGQ